MSSLLTLGAGLAAAELVLCRLPSIPLSPEFDALLLTALATAVDCAAEPPGLVFWVGSVSGVTCAVVAPVAAYAVRAVASWAQNSPYIASLAAIAGVFCPRMLVATSAASWARLAYTTGGGIVAENAASYAAAEAVAFAAASCSCTEVVLSQSMLCWAAAAAAADEEPVHSEPVS